MTFVKFKPAAANAEAAGKNFKKLLEGYNSPFFGEWGLNPFNSTFNPKVDVIEDKENLYVIAEVPGVDKNNIKINVTGDVLTISGEKKAEQKDENKNYFRITGRYIYCNCNRYSWLYCLKYD